MTVPTRALLGGVTPAELASSVELTLTQLNHLSRPLRTSPSSPTTAHSHNVLQVTSQKFWMPMLLQTSIPSVPHDDTHDLNPPIPMEVLPHPSRLTLAVSDSVVTILGPEVEDRRRGLASRSCDLAVDIFGFPLCQVQHISERVNLVREENGEGPPLELSDRSLFVAYVGLYGIVIERMVSFQFGHTQF
jgi:hypothetical protein